jgi:transposase
MMGERAGSQDRLFYDFCLEDVVPADHFLRKIDAVLDLTWLRSALAPYYSHLGCPSVCPELMIRMLIVGYCYSIRSERRLCDEVKANLAYRWFCRLGLEDKVPHHSTFSVNRHGRFRDSAILRTVFEEVVCGCMKAGLIGGEGFAVDASVIEADASRFERIEGAEIDWTEKQLSRRAIREYVDGLESESPPINPDRPPKALSPTDPCAAWTTRGRYKVMFAYSLNYLMDMEGGVILDVEATPSRISKEVKVTETMIARTEDRFGLKPDHVAGIYSRAAFDYDQERDIYICPMGKTLTTTGRVFNDNTLYYRARKADCEPCPLKEHCCPKSPARRVQRDVNEAARDIARSLADTDAYHQSAIDRKKIERLFAEAKKTLALDRLRLRGLTGTRDEFLLAAIVQNLKRLAKHVQRPPPEPMIA